jgi:carboxyl-terminal processing protease
MIEIKKLMDGPLVIMVNSFPRLHQKFWLLQSRIIKRDYCSKQTYGKGTVQNVIDLNQFVRSSDMGDLGALKQQPKSFIG